MTRRKPELIVRQPLNTGQPPVRGEAALRVVDGLFQRTQRVLDRLIPSSLNPLYHTGAIANTTLIVAIVTGVLLLFWYSSSVHQAYSSVEAMRQSWLPSLVRSLHRYSSDACMLFVLLHAVKLFFARKVTGARWVAWITGCLLLALLWLVGWLGYWLVWDARGHEVALGSALMIDSLPVFTDPLARSFLLDETVNSLLFFVVFFFHMLLPLAMGVALWLHVSRTARSRFLTDRNLTLWIVVSLTVLSVVLPAETAAKADMSVLPQRFTMDWWYLLPVALTDRLGGGALWGLTLLGSVIFASAPWLLRKTAVSPATTDPPKCNSCHTCFNDCPYEAITMVPRTDGSTAFALQAEVDPARCVGCGICSASCDSAGVGLLDRLPVKDERRRIEGWLTAHEGETAAGGPSGEPPLRCSVSHNADIAGPPRALLGLPARPPSLAFLCAESAGRGLKVDTDTGLCPDLPGYHALSVPCLGWVHSEIVGRALKRGAERVLLVGCAPEDCAYREGSQWAHERLEQGRKPALRDAEGIDAGRVRILELDFTQTPQLITAAAAFREGSLDPAAKQPSGPRAWVAGIVVCLVFLALTWLGSDLPYQTPVSEQPVLVVSFKHMGQVSQISRVLSAEEFEALPRHMRKKTVISERRRADVRLRISVDGVSVLEKAFAPGGLWGDRSSIALETIEIGPGEHVIDVAMSDAIDPETWTHSAQNTLTFRPGERRVLLFDRSRGFSWH